jgi:threonine synthase
MGHEYVSTRGLTRPASFNETAIGGLAPDGGLFVPLRWPSIDPNQLARFRNLRFVEIAKEILSHLLDDAVDGIDATAAAEGMVKEFAHPDVAPLEQLAENVWILELYHGPTLAFKDVAMQFMARIIEQITNRTGQKLNILTATSGDTGAAAVHAFSGCEGVRLFTLFPEGRISDAQRRQMTTVIKPNIFNIAVKGTFDDCQQLVKTHLADVKANQSYALTTVNSVNWARIAAQTIYYFFACSRLPPGHADPTFVVPTGNLGNAYSGYAARCMGAPIRKIVLANNRNDSLARALAGQNFDPQETIETRSPAMDIQNASNLERLLFAASNQDAEAIRGAMGQLELSGFISFPEEWRDQLAAVFEAASVNDVETIAEIERVYRITGRLVDPHTAVAAAAATKVSNCGPGPKVIIATADAAKFPETVYKATGRQPELPERLKRQLAAKEKFETMNFDLGQLRDYLGSRVWE